MDSVYVVLERRGDGYHTYEPELLMVYFTEEHARAHARLRSTYYYERVPLAPQVLSPPKGDRQDDV
jgi:hypothetical protein